MTSPQDLLKRKFMDYVTHAVDANIRIVYLKQEINELVQERNEYLQTALEFKESLESLGCSDEEVALSWDKWSAFKDAGQ